MLSHALKKVSFGINLIQFRVGEFLFPLLEPVFRILENNNLETKKHFQMALKNFETKNFSGALVNLNMVLSLCPKHFLARVFRARLYVHGRKYKLASEDYVVASQTNRFRFIHYDLYGEYLSSMNRGKHEITSSIIKNFNQAYEMLRFDKDRRVNFSESDSKRREGFNEL